MITANGTNHHSGNGVHAKALYPPCSSDYEPAPPIDITPTTPRPAWRDAHPLFVHHLEWIDSDGISHGLTLRSDSLSDLMADLKLVKGMIRQAKQKAAQSAPQQAETPAPDSDIPPCKIHGTPMKRRTSKRTGGIYFSHRMPGSKELCFGRERRN